MGSVHSAWSAAFKRAPTALEGYLVSCGVAPVDAMLIEAKLSQLRLLGLGSDDLAGALLRSASRTRRAAYREGFEDASEILSGIRQSPLVEPSLYEE